MIAAIFTVAILLADAAPAAASPPPDAAASAAKGPKVNKDGLVCHNEEVLGSRIPRKVCMTPADAADRAQQDRRNVERMQGQQGYRTQ
jgi:hypothetical protein